MRRVGPALLLAAAVLAGGCGGKSTGFTKHDVEQQVRTAMQRKSNQSHSALLIGSVKCVEEERGKKFTCTAHVGSAGVTEQIEYTDVPVLVTCDEENCITE